MTTITISGVDELFAKLGTLGAVETLVPPMQRGVYRLVAEMAVYPPPPSGSKYVRTGTLGRRWTSKLNRNANGVIGTIGNNTDYGPWVQSDAFQARVHQGRWQTDRQVVGEQEAAIVADFEQAIARAIR